MLETVASQFKQYYLDKKIAFHGLHVIRDVFGQTDTVSIVRNEGSFFKILR